MVLSKVSTIAEFKELMGVLADRLLAERKDDENSYQLCLLLAGETETLANFFR